MIVSGGTGQTRSDGSRRPLADGRAVSDAQAPRAASFVAFDTTHAIAAYPSLSVVIARSAC